MPKLLLVQGPNMSYLGRRQPEIYGKTSAKQLDAMLRAHALRDCLRAVPFPYIEVHISNIEKRGIKSILAETAVGVVAGFGLDSYFIGLAGMLQHLQEKRKRG